MLSSISDDPTSPLLSPAALPAGPARGFLHVQFHISSLVPLLQRIVGGEEGVSTCQSAGEGRVSEVRWNGVLCRNTSATETQDHV